MVDPSFRVTPGDDRTLHLSGELDMGSVPLLKAALERLPSQGSISLDLAQLTFVDSSGLHAIADYGKSLNGEGPLVLANVSESIAYVLDIVGFDKVETIEIRR
jgi:anti-anti-sigma factor